MPSLPQRPPPATIWFIRHGQTDWNAQGRLQGHRDVALNATGSAQAAALAERLRAAAGDALSGADFVASPLGRARRTMEILRGGLGLPETGARLDPRLREIGFGRWEGHTWAEIRRRDPAGAAARDRDRWNYCPRGEGAESYAMLEARVGAAAAQLERPTVMVAHGGTARVLLVSLGHLNRYSAPRMAVRQGNILVIEPDGWHWA